MQNFRKLFTIIIILIFSSVSFQYQLFWFLLGKTGLGWAYVIDQLFPLFVALIAIFYTAQKYHDFHVMKKYFLKHKFPLIILLITVLVVHGWILGNYFFGEEPTSILRVIASNGVDRAMSGFWRGWHLSIYISSFLIFGSNTLPLNVIILILYISNILLLYVLLFHLFKNKLATFTGTLFFATTTSYQDLFNWQSNTSGTFLALSVALLTLIFLLFYQKTNKFAYYTCSLLLFVALLKISFIRFLGFVFLPFFILLFPNLTLKINVKKSLLQTLPFAIIWFLILLFQYLIPERVIETIYNSLFPSSQQAIEATIRVRGDPIYFNNYLTVLAVFIAYLFIPADVANIVFPFIKNNIAIFSSGFLDPSLSLISGNIFLIALGAFFLGAIFVFKRIYSWVAIFALLFIFANIFYIPFFISEYHDSTTLDAMFIKTSAGYGPGLRYVFTSSIGLSILVASFLLWLLKQKKAKATFLILIIYAFILLNAYYAIANHQKALTDLASQKIVPKKLLSMLPNDGKRKLLFSTNPRRNSIDGKISGKSWLNVFYKESELQYTDNLDEVDNYLKNKNIDIHNLYAFFNNPLTNDFADITALVREELQNKTKSKPFKITDNESLKVDIIESGDLTYPYLLRRNLFASKELKQRFFYPKTLEIDTSIRILNFEKPYLNMIFIDKNTKYPLPIDLYYELKNGPALSGNDEIDKKLQISSIGKSYKYIPQEERIRIGEIIKEKELIRSDVGNIQASNIEPAIRISPNSLVDGIYVKSQLHDPHYQAKTTPSEITIKFSSQHNIGRILVNVPPGNPANLPLEISVYSSDSVEPIGSISNIESLPWSPNGGNLYEITTTPAMTDKLLIVINKTTQNAVMIDEIIMLPPSEVSPDIILQTEQVYNLYIDSQKAIDQILESPTRNVTPIIYICAEDKDWENQKKDFSTMVPGIWQQTTISLSQNKTVKATASINCFGSVLRKIYIMAPLYPSDITFNKISLY